MWLQRGSSDEELPDTASALDSGEDESGEDDATSSDDDDDERDCRTRAKQPWYYVPWTVAVAMVSIGICMVVLRSTGIWIYSDGMWPDSFFVNGTLDEESVREATAYTIFYSVGYLMMPVGIFLLVNADLVVTFIRFKLEIHHYKENNQRFRNLLHENVEEVRKLTQAEKALGFVQDRFSSNLDSAMAHVELLERDAEENIGAVAKELVKIYAGREEELGRRFIHKEGLNEAFSDFDTIFSGAIPSWPSRARILREVIKAHEVYQETGSLRVHALSELVEEAMGPHVDDETLRRRAKEILDRETLSLTTRWRLEDEEKAEEIRWFS